MIEDGRYLRIFKVWRALFDIGEIHQRHLSAAHGTEGFGAGQMKAAQCKAAFRRKGAGHGGDGGHASAVQQRGRSQCADNAVRIGAQMTEDQNGGTAGHIHS